MPCCMKQKSHKNGVARRGWFGGGSVLTEVLISETVVGNVSMDTISFLLIAVFSFFIQRRNSNILEIERDVGKLVECLSIFFFFFWNCLYCAGGPDSKRNKQRKAFCFATKFYKDVLSHQRNWGAQFLDTFMKRKDVKVAIRPKLFSHGA